jgi:hypothetical protein
MSLGQISEDLTTLVDECMRTRAELTGLAAHVGLLLEVPNATNGKTWPELGEAIHARIHEAIGLGTQVAGGASETKDN